MERVADYLNFRMQTNSDVPEVPENYGEDAGYGKLPEGLPTDMNTFFIEHGITGDKLHEITKEVNGDYEGFLKKALEKDETWGIPKEEWGKLSTNSRVDLMGPDAKRVSSELDRLMRKGNIKDNFEAAFRELADLAFEYSTSFPDESDDQEIWNDISESLKDLAERVYGLDN